MKPINIMRFCQTLFFTICDFHASTDVRMELLFQIVKIFIRIYHHMAHSNSMEYLLTFLLAVSRFKPIITKKNPNECCIKKTFEKRFA